MSNGLEGQADKSGLDRGSDTIKYRRLDASPKKDVLVPDTKIGPSTLAQRLGSLLQNLANLIPLIKR